MTMTATTHGSVIIADAMRDAMRDAGLSGVYALPTDAGATEIAEDAVAHALAGGLRIEPQTASELVASLAGIAASNAPQWDLYRAAAAEALTLERYRQHPEAIRCSCTGCTAAREVLA